MNGKLKVIAVFLLPLVLGALETVNLIKNHSFEREDEVWHTYTGTLQPMEDDSAKADARDSEAASAGLFSASADTRFRPGDPTPPPIMLDSAVIIQGFLSTKPLEDLDSLYWSIKIIPPELGYINTYFLFVSFICDAGEDNWIQGVYSYYNPRFSPGGDNAHRKIIHIELPDDTSWIRWEKSFQEDWINIKGLSPSLILDSISLGGYGAFQGGWLGQKVYWDDIRLMGYADYDVGVKEILSGDSLEVGTPYQPIARIKNFGRENADSFLVMAEIWDGASLIYVDTLPWTLEGDTEDTVEFADFDPPTTGPYTLTVRTHMTPDECDEDDELSKTIGQLGVAEEPILEGFSFEIQSLTTIRYSVPYATHVNLKVYDVSGRMVTKLVDGEVDPGLHTLRWEGRDDINRRCASGVYFVRFAAEDYVASKKMVLLK